MGKTRKGILTKRPSIMDDYVDLEEDWVDPEEIYDEETLDKIDEYLHEWANTGEHYALEDDDVIDYVDRYMSYDDDFTYTRVEKSDSTFEETYDYFSNMLDESFDFENYLTSFSSTMDATDRIMGEWYPFQTTVIYRVSGPVQHFNMYEYSDFYDWQDEHLLHGNGYIVNSVRDVSNDYPHQGGVVLVELKPTEENFVKVE